MSQITLARVVSHFCQSRVPPDWVLPNSARLSLSLTQEGGPTSVGGVESQLAALHSEELSLHCCLVYLFPDQYLSLPRKQGSLGFWSESEAYGHWVVQLCRPFRLPSPLQY